VETMARQSTKMFILERQLRENYWFLSNSISRHRGRPKNLYVEYMYKVYDN
jgi:hypothetical protein